MQLAVSLNGQQFHTLPFRYRWLTPPPNGSISGLPTSGPVEGGTLVTMSGPGLAGGDDYRCRFGGGRGGGRWSSGDEGGETRATAAAAEAMGAVVAATYDAAAGTLALPLPLTLACRSLTLGALAPTLTLALTLTLGTLACVSPAAALGAGEVLLEVSLNAKHFHAAFGFLYYGGVALSAVSPSSGPADGGTALALSGAGIHVRAWVTRLLHPYT